MQVILDELSQEALEQLATLMEHYLSDGFYMSPIGKQDGKNGWFLIPLDVLEGTAFYN